MTDPVRSGASLSVLPTGRLAAPKHVTDLTVIFVHGFTANGSYFEVMSDLFQDWGFSTLAFEYDSYQGIDIASQELMERLTPLQKNLRGGFVIVAHSLGGLVVRHFIRTYVLDPIMEGLKGVCTLGTPHGGTLTNNTYLSYLVGWSEWLTEFSPYLRLPTCRTALQLTRKDPEHLINVLNLRDIARPHQVPILSVSGGRPYIELGKGRVADFSANPYLQSKLDSPNDGLVEELSSDLTRVVPNNPNFTHFRDYTDYKKTNHTYLVRNHAIMQHLVDWCRERLAGSTT